MPTERYSRFITIDISKALAAAQSQLDALFAGPPFRTPSYPLMFRTTPDDRTTTALEYRKAPRENDKR